MANETILMLIALKKDLMNNLKQGDMSYMKLRDADKYIGILHDEIQQLELLHSHARRNGDRYADMIQVAYYPLNRKDEPETKQVIDEFEAERNVVFTPEILEGVLIEPKKKRTIKILEAPTRE